MRPQKKPPNINKHFTRFSLKVRFNRTFLLEMTFFPFNCDTNVRMIQTFKQDFVHCEAAACRPDLRNALASACSFATATAFCPADMASSCLIFLFNTWIEASNSKFKFQNP